MDRPPLVWTNSDGILVSTTGICQETTSIKTSCSSMSSTQGHYMNARWRNLCYHPSINHCYVHNYLGRGWSLLSLEKPYWLWWTLGGAVSNGSIII